MKTQEGLDFHLYCHAIVHWNLPFNPVDMEQREGRIHRHKGHAVRKNVAARHGRPVEGAAATGETKDPWALAFARARGASEAQNELVPAWLFPIPDGAAIERHVPAPPLSRDHARLTAIRKALALYRVVFGQPRQSDLLDFISAQVEDPAAAARWRRFLIDLSPG